MHLPALAPRRILRAALATYTQAGGRSKRVDGRTSASLGATPPGVVPPYRNSARRMTVARDST